MPRKKGPVAKKRLLVTHKTVRRLSRECETFKNMAKNMENEHHTYMARDVLTAAVLLGEVGVRLEDSLNKLGVKY